MRTMIILTLTTTKAWYWWLFSSVRVLQSGSVWGRMEWREGEKRGELFLCLMGGPFGFQRNALNASFWHAHVVKNSFASHEKTPIIIIRGYHHRQIKELLWQQRAETSRRRVTFKSKINFWRLCNTRATIVADEIIWWNAAGVTRRFSVRWSVKRRTGRFTRRFVGRTTSRMRRKGRNRSSRGGCEVTGSKRFWKTVSKHFELFVLEIYRRSSSFAIIIILNISLLSFPITRMKQTRWTV